MSWLSKGLKSAESAIGGVIPHESAASKRAREQAVQEEISYYKKAKADMEAETKRTKEERDAEAKRVAAKSIKNQRRAYRTPGFMDETETLG